MNGSQVFGIMPADDLAAIIIRRSNKENRIPSAVIIELVQKGLEHERLCGTKPHHVRTK